MDENIREDRPTVYEIGYLVAGVPEERVSAEADAVRNIVTGAGASIVAEEAPHQEKLAYTIRKKTVSGSYDKYDVAYFGWVKFEIGSNKIEAIKKAVEVVPSILRTLVITTVRENTYLGKRAPAVTASAFVRRPTVSMPGDVMSAEAVSKDASAAPVAPATVEEMDKSIDNMVKEA